MDEKSDSTKPEPPVKRRWFQYSIRSLMLVTLMIACWLGYISHNARKQKAAVAWVNEMDGDIHYDYEYDAKGKEIKNAQPPGPDWLRKWIGIDYFGDVTWVHLIGDEVKDISPLKSLRELEVLILGFTKIHDISPLEGMTRLERLSLDDTFVDDISVLANCKRLWWLRLPNTKVKEIAPLKSLTKMRRLTLSENQISDISSLKGLTSLEYLDLDDTQVTDSQLKHLEGLVNLKDLLLENTKVTKEGVEQLKTALPNCDIDWEGK